MLIRMSIILEQVKIEDWYKDGVKAAILAPTAVNQQKFHITRDGEQAKITAQDGMMTRMDLGIVKYNFEFVSGRKVK